MNIMLYPEITPTRYCMDLNGFWNFREDKLNQADTQQWHTGLPEPKLIAVPGSWNSQGVETEEKEFSGTGWYEKTFFVPDSFAQKNIFLNVGSVSFRAKLWINGQFVSSTDLPFLPFASDITDYIKPGEENTISIAVNNELAPDDIPPGFSGKIPPLQEGQVPWVIFDWYPYGGIHRSVELVVLAGNYIDDIAFKTIDIGTDSAEVEVSACAAKTGSDIKILLYDDKEVVAQGSIAGSSGKISFQVKNPKLWSCKTPFLYKLSCQLIDPDGSVIDEYSLKVGIRTISVDGAKLLLNGEPVFLKGFGKHEDFPIIGKGTVDAVIVKDYKLLEWIGANSYRTSHYPYDEKWLNLADQLGYLVIDEVAAIGLDFLEKDRKTKTFMAKHKEQLKALIDRDKNHPSVIMWSVSNEPNSEQKASSDYFKEVIDFTKSLDETRPVTVVTCKGKWFSPDGTGNEYANALADVICINRYFGWYDNYGLIETAMDKLSEDLDDLEQFGKPVILAEFGAECIPGFHDTADRQFSEEYQVKLIRETIKVAENKPFVVGTHVWNFADFMTAQSVSRIFGNHKGVFTRIREPKASAWALRKLWTGKDL